MKTFLIVVGAIAGVIVLYWIATYQRLVVLNEGANSAWGQVQNVYQRRADLVPNLVATVQGAASFEKSVLAEVTNARASVGKFDASALASNPEAMKSFLAAQQSLGSALGRLIAVAESYPDIKATQSFRDLQSQLEGTENRIAVERKRFQEAIRDYNIEVKGPFSRFVANMHGFESKPYFEASAGADKAPTVKF